MALSRALLKRLGSRKGPEKQKHHGITDTCRYVRDTCKTRVARMLYKLFQFRTINIRANIGANNIEDDDVDVLRED